nr:MAG TPA: hypothetical protein [Caudoviricetes sp.]
MKQFITQAVICPTQFFFLASGELLRKEHRYGNI